MSPIPVVAAVIRQDNRILISKRHPDAHQGGLWEFPGGKRESEESREVALIRELQEELGITPVSFRPIIQIPYHYPDKSVLLDVWEVNAWQGEASGLEGQDIQWVNQSELGQYEFPAANQPIIKASQLPEHYLITPAFEGDESLFLQQLKQALSKDIRLVQFRQKTLTGDVFTGLAKKVVAVCHQHDAKVLLNAAPEVAVELGADGVQLNASAMMGLHQRPLGNDYLIAASCHDSVEIQKACDLNLDFALLSPVQATASHPDTEPLGWPRFAEIVSQSTIPIYALGGVSREDKRIAWSHGGQGVSAIRALWQTH